MTVEEIRMYALAKKGVTESFPFDAETLVFKVGGKMFLLIPLEKETPVFTVKTNPEWSEELRVEYPQIKGAYHMNKTHWNSVEVDGVPKKLLEKLINHSYDLIFSGLTKKVKNDIFEKP